MSEKTLYLHIGTHKTATTTIQRFFVDNREAFQKNGLYYPKVPFTYPQKSAARNGLFLSGRCFDAEGRRDTGEEGRRFRAGMELVHGGFRICDKVLLSDENLYKKLYVKNRRLLKTLYDDSISHGYDIKLIICLRRQDGFKEALWNQRVKGATNYCGDFSDYSDSDRYYDYSALLHSFEEIVGRDNICVIRFSDLTSGEGVIPNFLSLLGYDLTDEYQIKQTETNARLYGNTVAVMQAFNSIPDLTEDDRQFLLKSLSKASQIAKERGRRSEYSYEERCAFMKAYEESNAEVAETYIGDGKPLFSDDYSGPPKRTTSDPEYINDIIRTFAYENILLREELRSAQNQLQAMQDQLQVTLKQLQELEKKIDRLRHPLKTIRSKVSN